MVRRYGKSLSQAGNRFKEPKDKEKSPMKRNQTHQISFSAFALAALIACRPAIAQPLEKQHPH